MYLCYVDDSGSDNIRTLTGLLVPAAGWSDVMHCWLEGRRAVEAEWGVAKSTELHAVKLVKGRGRFCVTEEQDKLFQKPSRIAAHEMLLKRLARCENVTVTTVACRTSVLPDVYTCFVEHLEEWAAAKDTHVMVVLDGNPGPADTDGLTAEAASEAWRHAVRNAAPYRGVHRGLPLASRRVLEDPVMQDSAHSQLIQAADMVAYAAYHHLACSDPTLWPRLKPIGPMSRSYRRLKPRWLGDPAGEGIVWRDAPGGS
ncbi:DUF3800 domain-containing protein [Kitasatospora sp. NPDC093679]|uniref:DUF3800 domain-containing protein n=1 Tax=Kitasatospora sp. NPDC093679 TaxID=3154983 RepID=UPI0034123849